MEKGLNQIFKETLKEAAEIACRGSAVTKDGRNASFVCQWEGGSYNNGAVMIVKVKGFKPNRYRIDTYAAQDPSTIKKANS